MFKDNKICSPRTLTLTEAVLIPLAFFTVRMYLPVSYLLQLFMTAIALVAVYVSEYFSPSSKTFSPFDQYTVGSGFPPTEPSRTRSEPAAIVTVSPTNLLSSSALGGAAVISTCFLKCAFRGSASNQKIYQVYNSQYSSLHVTGPVVSEGMLWTPAAFLAITRYS